MERRRAGLFIKGRLNELSKLFLRELRKYHLYWIHATCRTLEDEPAVAIGVIWEPKDPNEKIINEFAIVKDPEMFWKMIYGDIVCYTALLGHQKEDYSNQVEELLKKVKELKASISSNAKMVAEDWR